MSLAQQCGMTRDHRAQMGITLFLRLELMFASLFRAQRSELSIGILDDLTSIAKRFRLVFIRRGSFQQFSLLARDFLFDRCELSL